MRRRSSVGKVPIDNWKVDNVSSIRELASSCPWKNPLTQNYWLVLWIVAQVEHRKIIRLWFDSWSVQWTLHCHVFPKDA